MLFRAQSFDFAVIKAAGKYAEQLAAVAVIERAVRFVAGPEHDVERFQFDAINHSAVLEQRGGVRPGMRVTRFNGTDRIIDQPHAQAVLLIVVVHARSARPAIDILAIFPRNVSLAHEGVATCICHNKTP